jgi:hypothetical protein
MRCSLMVYQLSQEFVVDFPQLRHIRLKFGGQSVEKGDHMTRTELLKCSFTSQLYLASSQLYRCR